MAAPCHYWDGQRRGSKLEWPTARLLLTACVCTLAHNPCVCKYGFSVSHYQTVPLLLHHWAYGRKCLAKTLSLSTENPFRRKNFTDILVYWIRRLGNCRASAHMHNYQKQVLQSTDYESTDVQRMEIYLQIPEKNRVLKVHTFFVFQNVFKLGWTSGISETSTFFTFLLPSLNCL